MNNQQQQQVILQLIDNWLSRSSSAQHEDSTSVTTVETLQFLLQYQLISKGSFSFLHFHHLDTIGHSQSYNALNSSGGGNEKNLYWPTSMLIHNSMILIADNGYSRINIFDKKDRRRLCWFRIPKQSPEQLIIVDHWSEEKDVKDEDLIISSTFRVFSLNLTRKLNREPLEQVITEQELNWNVKFDNIITRICQYNQELIIVALETGQLYKMDCKSGNIVEKFQFLDENSQTPYIPTDLIFISKSKTYFLLEGYKNRIVSIVENQQQHCFNLNNSQSMMARSIFFDSFRDHFYISTHKNVHIYNRDGILIRKLLDENQTGRRLRQPNPFQVCLPYQSFIHENLFYVVDYDHHRVLIFQSD